MLEISVKKTPKGFEDVCLFLVMARQIPSDNENAAFAWSDENNVVKLKLGDPDVGELLAVLRGLKSEVGTGKGLYHQNSKGNSSLNFSYNQEKNSFFLAGSSKRGDNLVKISHMVTVGEAMILQVLLEEFIRREYDFGNAVPFEKQ
jgi:hypothetical protein